MKKIAAIVVFAFIALTAFANKYTDKLTVTVNGESMEQQTTIDVTKGDDGKYTLSLNNFCLESPNEDGTLVRLGVGNIILPDREGTTVDGVTTITYNDALLITEGNDAGIEGWMGPLLGPVPIEMVARFNDTQLYCEIHINLMDDGLMWILEIDMDQTAYTAGALVHQTTRFSKEYIFTVLTNLGNLYGINGHIVI